MAQANLESLQQEIRDVGYSGQLFLKEVDAHNELNDSLDVYTSILKQKILI